MPSLTVRNIQDVPRPNRSPKAIRDAQLQYDQYVQAVNTDVGELIPDEGENIRGIKVRLRRAATRLAKELAIWDANGKVYFKVEAKRGRPRKA